jgi:hypothetical protein
MRTVRDQLEEAGLPPPEGLMSSSSGQLVDADALSKFADRYDFSLTVEAMQTVRDQLEEAGLGSWDVGRSAAAHNKKALRFKQFSFCHRGNRSSRRLLAIVV